MPPKQFQLSSFDIAALVRGELQGLIGSYIDQFYHRNDDEVLLKLKKPDKSKANLLVKVGSYFYIADEPGENPITPTSFAMLLRKLLSNGRVTKIEQEGFDRIVTLTIQKAEEYHLVFEMFGDGNAILVKDGEIIQPLRHQSWSHRVVRRGHEYKPPPQRTNPLDMGKEEFTKVLKESKKDLVRALATDVNIGGIYAEEMIAIAREEKSRKASELSDDEIKELYRALEEVIAKLDHTAPTVVYGADGPVAMTPAHFMIHQEYDSKEFHTISEAISHYLAQGVTKPVSESAHKYNEAVGRLKRQLAQQSEAIQKQDEKADLDQAIGEAIYEHYSEVEKILKFLSRSATAEEWDGLKIELGPKGISIEGMLENRMATIMLSKRRAILDGKININENAALYYDKAKKAKERMEGARNALEETKKAFSKLKEQGPPKDKASGSKKTNRKKFWFENYRWFISSDGNVVVGGRDAKTNDKAVKKYLMGADRYAHAETHGAASIIAKSDDGKDIPENTLREACHFAVIHSKSWNAKVGSGRAYWVLPDQVSKTPQSGEFVPRGAFIIRGKRNYEDNLTLEAAVGEIEYGGEKLISCGPVSAISAQCEKYVIIVPGKFKKETLARKLAGQFHYSVDEVNKVLPTGGSDILRNVGPKE